MAHLLGLEWDGREARVAIAQRRGADVVFEHAFTVDFGRVPGEALADADIGKRILAALSARQLARCETLVAVGRTRIELRSLTLPPSPAEELPDLVRFQALRQFAAIGEDWPIDFVHLSSGEEESHTVLAAAISPEMVEQIRATCAAASQEPKRLVLRPFAAASLLRRRTRDNSCRLLVDLLAEEADLTVIADRQLAFMRTIRLPEGDDPQKRQVALLGEIRRTMVAAQNQLGGRRVEQIVLCGGEEEHALLRARLVEALEIGVELFDPFSEARLGGELAAGLPPNPGRFAPLVGMLLDECSGAAHAIDFLHPRKKPRPKSQRRLYAIAAIGAAALLLVSVGLGIYRYFSMGQEIVELQQKIKELAEVEQAAGQVVQDVGKIDEWTQGDVPWLDELSYLSRTFPPADAAIVTQLSVAAVGKDNIGGRVFLDGAAVRSETISEIERGVRDDWHEVQGAGGTTDNQFPGYPWVFKKMVTVKPPSDDAPSPFAADANPAAPADLVEPAEPAGAAPSASDQAAGGES